MTARASLIAVLAILTSSAAWSDDVAILRSGLRLQGELKGLENGRLQFKEDELDNVRVKWENVAGLESSREFEIETIDRKLLFGSLGLGEEAGTLRIVDETGQAIEIALGSVVRIEPHTFWGALDGSVSLGLNIATASDLYQFSSHFDASYVVRRWRHQLTFDTLVNDADDKLRRTSRQDLVLSARTAFAGRWDAVASAIGRSNEELGLDRRLTFENVALYYVVANSRVRLGLGPGLAVGLESVTTGPTEENYEGVAALSLRVFSSSGETDAVWELRGYRSFSIAGRNRLELNGRITRNLIADLFLSATVYYSFDSDSPAESGMEAEMMPLDPDLDPPENKDFTLSLNIGYRF